MVSICSGWHFNRNLEDQPAIAWHPSSVFPLQREKHLLGQSQPLSSHWRSNPSTHISPPWSPLSGSDNRHISSPQHTHTWPLCAQWNYHTFFAQGNDAGIAEILLYCTANRARQPLSSPYIPWLESATPTPSPSRGDTHPTLQVIQLQLFSANAFTKALTPQQECILLCVPMPRQTSDFTCLPDLPPTAHLRNSANAANKGPGAYSSLCSKRPSRHMCLPQPLLSYNVSPT